MTSTISSGYSVEVDGVTLEAWHRLMAGFRDANLYQTWCYGAVRWGEGSLGHVVLRKETEAVGLAQVRIFRVPKIGVGVAYVTWGPIFDKNSPERETICALIQGLKKEYVGKRKLCLRILPNCLAGSASGELLKGVLEEEGFQLAGKSPEYRTFLVDLAPPLPEIRRQLDQKWRNQLNQAERNKLEMLEGTQGHLWELFEKLYFEMMARKPFETTVDIKEFAEIQKALPAELKMRIFVCQENGTPVAGLVCSPMGQTGINLLAATNERALKLRAANLVYWAAIQRLKADGFRYFDLGGADPEFNPGGYHFKAGLGGQDVTHLPGMDFVSSPGQRLVLNAIFQGAGLWRGYKTWRNKRVSNATQ